MSIPVDHSKKRHKGWIIGAIISFIIAIEELIGWEIKKAHYGEGLPAGLPTRFISEDMPYANFIEFGTVIIFLALAYFFWFKYNQKYEIITFDENMKQDKPCNKCMHLYNNFYCRNNYIAKLNPSRETCNYFKEV